MNISARKIYIGLFSLCIFFAMSASTSAIETLVESVAKGCETELEEYCNDVTPGEGRVLACLYAYEDKLSGQCEYALYDAAAKLERFIEAISYVVHECDEDLEKYCSSVAVGEGRLLKCLDDHSGQISKACRHALEDTGMK